MGDLNLLYWLKWPMLLYLGIVTIVRLHACISGGPVNTHENRRLALSFAQLPLCISVSFTKYATELRFKRSSEVRYQSTPRNLATSMELVSSPV